MKIYHFHVMICPSYFQGIDMTIMAIMGAGNMGASLIGGLIATGFQSHQLWVTDPDKAKLQSLHKQFGVHISCDNAEAVSLASVVILAVKPQVMHQVVQPLATIIQKNRPLLISIAAGLREENLQQWVGQQQAIIRCMPNTPALIRCGMTALYANTFVSIEQRQLAETILSAVGQTIWLSDEKQMDAVTALSGSGPAYFFLVMEALQHAGEHLGLPAETARLLTQQTALGAVRMALESSHSLTQLREQVTSPGGTTEAALRTLEAGHMRELFQQALIAAQQRAEQLAQEVALK